MNVDFSKTDGGAGTSQAPVIDIKVEQVPTPVEGLAVESVAGFGPYNLASGAASPVGEPGPQGQPGVGVPAVQPAPSFVSHDDLPGFRDVMFPRINLVQNLGELKDTFSPGEVVFGKQTVLFTPPNINASTGNVAKQGTPPAIIHFLGVTQKRFHEIVVGGMGGIIVNTEDEIRAAGGTLDYNEWKAKQAAGMKRFGPMIEFLVVIQRPEHCKDDDTVFSFQVDDRKYALGLWSLQKTSYTEGYKKTLAFQRRAGVLKDGYPTFSFALSTRENPYDGGKKKAWVPVLIPSGKVTPAFAEFVNNIINPTA